MSILRANLKHLYQRRGVLLYCLASMGWLFIIYSWLRHEKRYLGYLLFSYLIGIMVGSFQKEILSRPFSFCLPGHSDIPRRFIFVVGIVLNGLLGFVFMFYPGLELLSVFLAVLAGGVVGLLVYLLVAGVQLFCDYRRNATKGIFLLIIVFGAVYYKWDLIVQDTIVTSPLIVISSGLLLCWFAWRWLGRESLSRKYCGQVVIGIFDCWNREKMVKFGLALAEKDKKKPNSMRASDGVEEFFVSRISRAETGSLPQYIWGSLYKSFGIMFSQKRQGGMGFMLVLLMICFLCYLPGGGKNIIFLAPGLMVVFMNLWVRSSLLVCGGRRERFWSGLTLVVTTGILITGVVVLLALSTQLLAGILPPLTVQGREYTFGALNMNLAIVPFLMIPVSLTFGLIFYKKPMLAMLFAMILFQVFFISNIVDNLTIFGWRTHVTPAAILMMLFCSWAVFIAVLRYISMRCCLVRQTK